MNSSKVALIVAAALGVGGAALNFAYLQEKAGKFEKEEFIGIAPGVNVLPGDRFTEEKLVRVPVPAHAIGELKQHAVLWSELQTVIGMPAVRPLTRGDLLMRADLRTPPPTMALTREDERAIFIPVDTRTFVPALVNPGDLVSFYVSGVPTPASPPGEGNGDGAEPPPVVSGPRPKSEVIGPFRILSLGNRLGSAEVHKASGVSQLQENVVGIAVKFQGEQLEPRAAKLLAMLQGSGLRQAGVVLHPRK